MGNTPARNRSHIQLLYRYTVGMARAKNNFFHLFGKINVTNDKSPFRPCLHFRENAQNCAHFPISIPSDSAQSNFPGA